MPDSKIITVTNIRIIDGYTFDNSHVSVSVRQKQTHYFKYIYYQNFIKYMFLELLTYI